MCKSTERDCWFQKHFFLLPGRARFLPLPDHEVAACHPFGLRFHLCAMLFCPRFLPAPSLLVRGSKIHAFRKKWRVEPSPSLHRLGLVVCLPAPLPSFLSLSRFYDFYCCENNGGFWPLCIWVFPLASSADFLEAIAGGPGNSPSPTVVRLRLVGGATWGIPEAVQ